MSRGNGVSFCKPSGVMPGIPGVVGRNYLDEVLEKERCPAAKYVVEDLFALIDHHTGGRHYALCEYTEWLSSNHEIGRLSDWPLWQANPTEGTFFIHSRID